MRTRTFVLSFLVHSLVLGMVMVVRTFATTELPDPPVSTKFMMVATPEVPDVPPPQQQRPPQSATPTTNETAVPLKAPDAIAPEVPRDIPDTVAIGPDSGIIPGSTGLEGGIDGVPPPPRTVTPPPPPPPVHPGGVIKAPQKIHHVAPTYPPIAQAARVSGIVILEALIAEDGSVREVKVLRSLPLLDAAAIDAVRQWRFTPTLLNGVPVQVIMTVTVTFNLN